MRFKIKRQQPERAERLAFIALLELQYPQIYKYTFAIEPGGSRNKIEAYNLKRIGVKPGTADYFIMYPSNGKHGLWLEFKVGTNKLSKVQKEFKNLALSAHYDYITVWSAEEGIEAVKKHWGL